MRASTTLFASIILVSAGSLGVAAFFLGGFFSVAASEQDPSLVNWALIHVREASIARHATEQPPGSLADADMVSRGAKAYAELGCTTCHGGLGARPARFSKGLNPQPNLKAVIKGIKPQELFWVLKNGIKMTGMPSFGTGDQPVSDQEIWDVVAFLKQVPSLSDDDLKSWSEMHRG